jgi:hypothetical protein
MSDQNDNDDTLGDFSTILDAMFNVRSFHHPRCAPRREEGRRQLVVGFATVKLKQIFKLPEPAVRRG